MLQYQLSFSICFFVQERVQALLSSQKMSVMLRMGVMLGMERRCSFVLLIILAAVKTAIVFCGTHNYSCHCVHAQVVQQILLGDAESELYNLIRRFRIAFVEHVKPQFLPDNWTVDHCASRHFGQFSIFYQGEKKASSPK